MKKLMFVTDESILGGCARSGVAEVVDSLANSVAADYAVTVVCPGWRRRVGTHGR